MGRFDGKAVIVTGSSTGIGRAIAVRFAQEGARVTISGRKTKELQETVNQMKAAGGDDARINVVQGDITAHDVQEEIIESTLYKFHRIDVLVNNAGALFTDPTGKTGSQASIESFQRTFDVNVTSVVELVKRARPHLQASKGEIVNISSIGSLPFAAPDWTMYYSMAKASLDTLTRSLAVELVERGVRVNAINPGWIRTDFMSNMGVPNQGIDAVYDYVKTHKDCVPIGEIGSGEDIANLTLFLADRSQSFYIIGETIVADGGSSLLIAAGEIDFEALLRNIQAEFESESQESSI